MKVFNRSDIYGAKICITGEAQIYTRDELANLIVSYGGIFQKSITSATSYLIEFSDSGATKLAAAKKNKVPIIPGSQFIAALQTKVSRATDISIKEAPEKPKTVIEDDLDIGALEW